MYQRLKCKNIGYFNMYRNILELDSHINLSIKSNNRQGGSEEIPLDSIYLTEIATKSVRTYRTIVDGVDVVFYVTLHWINSKVNHLNEDLSKTEENIITLKESIGTLNNCIKHIEGNLRS